MRTSTKRPGAAETAHGAGFLLVDDTTEDIPPNLQKQGPGPILTRHWPKFGTLGWRATEDDARHSRRCAA